MSDSYLSGFLSTTDINAQARKLQRNRAKGTMTLQHGSSFCRSLSETSLNLVGLPGEEPKRYYSTLPGPIRTRSARDTEIRKDGGGVKHSLYQSPHLLLLQGYNQQVRKITYTFYIFITPIWSSVYCLICFFLVRIAWFTC